MMQKRVHGNTGVSKSDNSCIGKNENEEEWNSWGHYEAVFEEY